MGFNIAIDGPAGAGKSTIAKKIAAKKGYIYVDTGAMYRAMALYLLREHVNPAQTEEIDKRCQDADITIAYENGEQVVYLNGENVNGYIRTEELVAKGVSCDLATIEQDIIERDRQDMTREISPLKQAEDAVLLDSSHMTVDEVVDAVIGLCEA